MSSYLRFLLALLFGALTFTSLADDEYPFENGYPTSEATKKAQDDADYQRAVTAYRFWYPAVSAEGIFNGNRALGMQDNETLGISAAGPRQVGFTLNSDTPIRLRLHRPFQWPDGHRSPTRRLHRLGQ